jgi:hypothetical protein
MSIDPRLKERRKTVAEEKAKRNIGRLLKFMAFVVLTGTVIWVVLSPWFSVARVATSGIEASDSHAVLAAHGVVAGTPMIMISASRVEAALVEDPWVAEASVQLNWPNDVTVDVTERVPVAWVETASGWARHDIEGYRVPSEPEPDRTMARVEMPHLAADAAPSSVELRGALEFAATLRADLSSTVVLRLVGNEFWATVSSFEVRLGRPVEMTAKALSLEALLGEDIPEGSTLVIIAPTHPSYLPPALGDDDDGTGESDGDNDSGEEDEDDV